MEYYVSINNEKRGPYSVEELRARGITAETLLMADNGEEYWQAAWQIEEIRPIINNKEPETASAKATEPENVAPEIPVGMPIAEQPQPPFTGQQEQPHSQQPQQPYVAKKKKSHVGCLFSLLLLTIIVIAAIFTCPDSQRHKEVVTNVMTETLNDMSASESNDEDLLTHGIRVVGNLLVGGIADTAIDKMLTVDNYVVCSIGKVHYNGKDHVVSVGAFGHIFTINKESLTKSVDQYYQNIRKEAEDAVKQQIQEHVVDPVKDKLRESVIDPIDEMFGGMMGDILGGMMGEEPAAPSDQSENSDHSENSENSEHSDYSDQTEQSESNL